MGGMGGPRKKVVFKGTVIKTQSVPSFKELHTHYIV